MATENEPFRDFLPGLSGRRDDLLRKRRDELATMPHVLRRIYVARSSRVAAAIGACIGGAVLMGASIHPAYERALADLLPGRTPAVLSTLLIASVVGALLIYLAARAIAEHRFTMAMSRCVLPTEDVTQDVERLHHTRPEAVAARMIDRLSSPASALPTAAAALVGPCAGIYGLMALANLGYPAEHEVDGFFAGHSTALVIVALAGATAAAVLGVLHRRGTRATAIALAFGTLIAGFGLTIGWVGVVVPGFFGVAAVAVYSRFVAERERRIVELEDLGVTVWTVGAIARHGWELARQAWSHVTWTNIIALPSHTRRALGTSTGRWAAALVLVATSALVYRGATADASHDNLRQTSLSAPSFEMPKLDLSAFSSSASSSQTTPVTTSSFSVGGELTFVPTQDRKVPLVTWDGKGIAVPAGWTATVEINAWSRSSDKVIHVPEMSLNAGGVELHRFHGSSREVDTQGLEVDGKVLYLRVLGTQANAGELNVSYTVKLERADLH